jgi:acylphosphatase
MRKLVHLIVKGKVQGVGYRAFVELQAELLDLEGWVRNRRDGTVEVVAAGDSHKIEKFIKECSKGPPASRVAAIHESEATEEMLTMRNAGEKFSFLPTL